MTTTGRPVANLARQVDAPGAARREQTRARYPDAEALAIRFVDWYCRTTRDYLDGQAAGVGGASQGLRRVG